MEQFFIVKKLRIWVIIFILSIIISIFLTNEFGSVIQVFETNIYRKITGKQKQQILIDSLGVPFIAYEGGIGNQYNPVSVAEYAIRIDPSNNLSDKRSFWSCISWLCGNYIVLNDSAILFQDNFDWPSYGMKSPWRSAMNQGRAIQAFIKAYRISEDSIYLDLAYKSMNALFIPVNSGGVTYFDSTGYWYEEYADDDATESRVLNGMIVVLQALSDFFELTKDQNALYLFNQGILSVKNTIHLYDNNGHSYYDVLKKPAKPWYHQFHVELLGFLFDKTGDPIFFEYMQKWSSYKEPSYLNKLIKDPTTVGIYCVLTVFFCVSLFISLIVQLWTYYYKKHRVS